VYADGDDPDLREELRRLRAERERLEAEVADLEAARDVTALRRRVAYTAAVVVPLAAGPIFALRTLSGFVEGPPGAAVLVPLILWPALVGLVAGAVLLPAGRGAAAIERVSAQQRHTCGDTGEDRKRADHLECTEDDTPADDLVPMVAALLGRGPATKLLRAGPEALDAAAQRAHLRV
jgi:hypothetical protein